VITRRRVVVATAIVVLAGLVLLTPRTEAPQSMDALRRFLGSLGYDVSEGAGLPPAGGTFVIVEDVRRPDEAQAILEWVQDGGHLVVTDPMSEFLGPLGGTSAATIGFIGTQELAPGCVSPAVVGVERVVVRATDRVLESADPAVVSCFPVGDGAFLLTRDLGDGRLTVIGGPSAFTSAMLRDEDNAVLAAGLAGPGQEVVFGPPASSAPGPIGLWDALPDGARAAVVGIATAAVAFALVRARRLGRPAVEEPIAPIPGSELVRAAGRMYRQARATGYAGTLMRRAAAARLSRRLGGVGTHDLVATMARASGLPQDRVGEILGGREPRSDEELMELGAELEGLSARAEIGSR